MDLSVEVVGKRAPATDVAELTLAARDGSQLPAWSAGSHIEIALPGDLRRRYSLCGDPVDRHEYKVAVLRTTDSRGGSIAVHDTLAVGDTVRISSPINRFALEPAGSYVFFAGGIGVTPIRPMVENCHARAVDWQLHYGGRSRQSMAFATDLVDRHGSERVRLYPQRETGYIDVETVLKGAEPDALIYVCGPQAFIELVRTQARALGRLGQVRSELFIAENESAPDSDKAFEIHLAATGITVTVPRRTSALEAILAAGVVMEYDCQSGVCGTCITRVVSGAVDHRDHVLSDGERESNTSMAPCVSRARRSPLVLDA